MAIPADRSSFAWIRFTTRRALVVWMCDAYPSPALLLALAGLPVLAAAWALMSPPVVFTSMEIWDFLYNLAGAWCVYLGHVAHVDFSEPVGQLYFILTAIGFHLLGPSPFAFLVNVALVTSVLFVTAYLAVWRRLPLLPASLFVVFVCLLTLMPVNIGTKADGYSFAMSYNRYCWSAFSILALIVFIPPRNRRGSDWIDMAIVGLLLVAMFYLKITYFAAGLAAIAFALLFHPHVRRRWPGWLTVGALATANALAPYNHPYLVDILDAARDGAVRSALSPFVSNFLAAAGAYAPYVACFAIACWMWLAGRASVRLPLTIAFLFVMGLFLLSQNTQASGLPSNIVIAFVVYDWLRTRIADWPNREIAPLLLALLTFPAISIAASAATLAGYHHKASDAHAQYVVDHTNLRGLAVPAGERGAFASFPRGDEPPGQSTLRYDFSPYEYVKMLLEAADLLADRTGGEPRPPGKAVLFDQVDPLAFMLGLPPVRGATLYATWNLPPADYLADVEHVLIPKFPIPPNFTEVLVSNYSRYLDKHFQPVANTSSWLLLARSGS